MKVYNYFHSFTVNGAVGSPDSYHLENGSHSFTFPANIKNINTLNVYHQNNTTDNNSGIIITGYSISGNTVTVNYKYGVPTGVQSAPANTAYYSIMVSGTI